MHGWCKLQRRDLAGWLPTLPLHLVSLSPFCPRNRAPCCAPRPRPRPLLRPQTTGVHVWFVAHPRQLREWKGQAPNLYDISGSAHFINKADNGIVVHRDRDPESTDQHRVGSGGGPWVCADRADGGLREGWSGGGRHSSTGSAHPLLCSVLALLWMSSTKASSIATRAHSMPLAPPPQVQILVRKVRNKAAGTIGDCALEYERINGR